MFDKMMGVKLASGVFTNDARKNLEGNCYFLETIVKQF